MKIILSVVNRYMQSYTRTQSIHEITLRDRHTNTVDDSKGNQIDRVKGYTGERMKQNKADMEITHLNRQKKITSTVT